MTRTKGPWYAQGKMRNDDRIIRNDDGPVAIVVDHNDYGRDAEVDATAAFIVQACNAHDGLVEALTEMLVDAETMNEPYRNEAICERARAALKGIR